MAKPFTKPARSSKLPFPLLLGWVAWLLSIQGSWAQSKPPAQPLLPAYFLPKSPTVEEFPRYDKQELVHLPTGGAQLAIPVADLQSGPLHLPLALNYAFTGLQVYQPRELVGLGWSLQAGTSIALHVTGLLDGQAVGGDAHYNPDSISLATQSFLNRVGPNAADSGPDLYSFSLPGGASGYFLLRDTTAVLLPKQPLHVRLLQASSKKGFQVATEDGVRYQFEKSEMTHSGGEFGLGTFTSAWQLTRIISGSNADTIQFYYSAAKTPQPTFRRFAVTTGTYAVSSSSVCGSGTYQWTNSLATSTQLSPQFLDSILTRGTRIVLKRDPLTQVIQAVQTLSTVGARREVRRFTLFQSSFEAVGNPNPADIHLRLDSVQEQAGALRRPPYRFAYNTTLAMPPRSSAALDNWGYYNGQYRNGDASNSTGPALLTDPALGALMPIRTPAFSYALAGALLRVTYPTGGTSRWEYEPSLLATATPPTSVRDTTSIYVTNDYEAGTSQPVPPPIKNHWATYSQLYDFQLAEPGTIELELTRIAQDGDPYLKSKYQDFRLWRQGGGADSMQTVSTNPVLDYSILYLQSKRRFQLPLTAGHYVLQLYCEPNESFPSGTLKVPHTSTPVALEGTPGAGVRVKRTRTATPGAPPLWHTYQYLVPDSTRTYSSGVLLAGGGSYAYKATTGIKEDCSTCSYAQTSSDNSHIGDEFNRYSFFYRYVTVQDSLTQGATTFQYTNLETQFNDVVLTGQYTYRQHPQRAGHLQLLQADEYTYGADSVASYPFLRTYLQRADQTTGGGGQTACPTVLTRNLYAVAEMLSVNAAFTPLRLTRQTRYEGTGNSTTLTRADYVQQRLMHTTTSTSTGWRSQHFKRLWEYVATPAVRALRVNYFNPVIETQTWQRPLASPDSVLVAGQLTLYDPTWRNPAREYRLHLTQPVAGLNRETRTNGHYDNLLSDTRYELTGSVRYAATTGELLEQRPAHGLPTSYLLGYARTLLIAQAQNATYAQLAYTSFETESTGRWTYDSVATSAARVPDARTGHYGYRLSGADVIGRDRLPAGDYLLSVWVQGAGQPGLTLLGGTPSGPLQEVASTTGNWRHLRVALHFSSPGTVQLGAASGGAAVVLDDLLLQPVGAQVTTYTHDPLVGETSQTGPDGRTYFFDYDGLGRLVRTRDEQGRILSQQQYHYAGK